jgi:hypothetical protein
MLPPQYTSLIYLCLYIIANLCYNHTTYSSASDS